MINTRYLIVRTKIMKCKKLSKYDIITLSKWYNDNFKIEYLKEMYTYNDFDGGKIFDYFLGLEEIYKDGLSLLSDLYDNLDKFVAFQLNYDRYYKNNLKLLTSKEVNKLFIEEIYNNIDYWSNKYLKDTDYFEYTFQDRLSNIKGYYPELIGDYQERKANEAQNRYCECEIEYY